MTLKISLRALMKNRSESPAIRRKSLALRVHQRIFLRITYSNQVTNLLLCSSYSYTHPFLPGSRDGEVKWISIYLGR